MNTIKKILNDLPKLIFFIGLFSVQTSFCNHGWGGHWLHFMNGFNKVFFNHHSKKDPILKLQPPINGVDVNLSAIKNDSTDRLFFAIAAEHFPVGEHHIAHQIVNEILKHFNVVGFNLGNKTWPEHSATEWRYVEHGLAFLFGMSLQGVNRKMFEKTTHYGNTTFDHYSKYDICSQNDLKDYIKALFKDFLINAKKINSRQSIEASAPPTLTSTADLRDKLKFQEISSPGEAFQVDVFDQNKILLSTRRKRAEDLTGVDSNAIAKSKPEGFFPNVFQENDIYQLKNGEFQKLTKRAIDFRHALKTYTGHIIKCFYSESTPGREYFDQNHWGNMFTYGGEGSTKNPINPFDPTSPWGVVDLGLESADESSPVIHKTAYFGKDGKAWVHGSDAQPYIVLEETPSKSPYLMPYRDSCISMGVGDKKMAVLHTDSKIRVVKDISEVEDWRPPYDEIDTSSPWRAQYDVSLHPNHETRWWDYGDKYVEVFGMRVKAQSGTPKGKTVVHKIQTINDPVYKHSEITGAASNKTSIDLNAPGADTKKVFVSKKDDSIWALQGGKLFKGYGSDVWKEMHPGPNIEDCYFADGCKDRIMVKIGGMLQLLIDDETKTWHKLYIITSGAGIGTDGSIVVINPEHKLMLAKPDVAIGLRSIFENSGPTVMGNIKNQDGTENSFFGSSPLNIKRHGFVVEIEKDGKVLVASNSADLKAAAGTAPIFKIQEGRVEIPKGAHGHLDVGPGQWIVVPGLDKTTLSLRERLSGLYIGADGNLSTTPAFFKVSMEEVGKQLDFELFMKNLDQATEFTTAAGVNISEISSKIIMLAASCKVFVNDETLKPTTTDELTKETNKEFFNKDVVPICLAEKSRASKVLSKFDEISKKDAAKTAILLDNPNLAVLIKKSIDAITGAFSKDKALKKLGKKILKRFGGPKTLTSFSDRFNALKEDFKTLKKSKVNDFFTKLESLVNERIDGIIEGSTVISDLNLWVNKLLAMTEQVPSVKILKESGLFDKIAPLKAKLAKPLSMEEVVDRLEHIAIKVGAANSAQQEVFSDILSKLASGTLPASALKTEPADLQSHTQTIGPIWRMVLHKKKLGKILSMAGKFKTLNPGATIDTHTARLKNAKTEDFRSVFLDITHKLLFDTTGHLDSDGLWQTDTTDANKLLSLDVIDPSQCYTLAQFWSDFSAWENWEPDLKKPENRIPLLRICNQVKDSVKKHFSGDEEKEKIKAEAENMITKLASAAK